MNTNNPKNSDRLIDLALALSQQNEYEELIRLVSQRTSQLLDAKLVLVMMVNPRTHQTIKTIRQEGAEITQPKYKFVQTLISGWIMQNDESILIPNIQKYPNFNKIDLSGITVKSVLGVPLRVEGALIGSLILFNKNNDQTFNSEDLEYLEKLSVIAAPFLRNVYHIQQYFESPLPEAALLAKYEKIGLIGKSIKFINLLKSIEAAARCEVRVLLEGRSGTGKELVAKAIHQNSQRNQNPFLAVDCGAIPTNIIESELFGHVKGAFTGANFDRKGLVLEANRGTLFLDEILNLPLDMQAKLLRFLQEGEVRPVGSNLSKKVDVRVITASSIPLKQLVHEQKFREDLYYRLYVYPISISDLTEREEDIPILANAFLYKFAKQQNKTIEKFHETILTYFKERQWEGNIRELENFVERLVTLLPMNVRVINFSNLPEPILEEIKKEKSEVVSENISKALEESVADYEAELIRQALENNHWNKSKAARVLKISEGTIRYKIEKLGISKPQD